MTRAELVQTAAGAAAAVERVKGRTTMGALGHQGLRALREPIHMRLVTEHCQSPTLARVGEKTRNPGMALGDPETTRRTETALLRRQLADRDARIAELEADLAHAHGQVEAAREAGRRESRETTARTLGGRFDSILTPLTRR